MSLGAGILLFVIGAILTFALNVSVDWINLDLVGYILMAAGAVGIILGIVLIMRRRRTVVTHSSTDAAAAPRYETTTERADDTPPV